MSSPKPPSGLMIAAPSSGSGKTVITLAILRALKRKGIAISSAKAGPDYIDPAFHQIASGKASVNLDPWAMSKQRIQTLAVGGDTSFLLVEAMMGLFDGAADGTGSAADLSASLSLPVVLVVDAAKQSHSIAAVVSGFRDFRKDLQFAGVILNKVGSPRHDKMLREALNKIDVQVFGSIPRLGDLELPERHLGLVQAGELSEISSFIDNAADYISEHCDLDLLVDAFAPIQSQQVQAEGAGPILPLGQKIAIARDSAFSFIYPHLLQDWQSSGCELSFFSPLKDEGPAEDVDAVFLPGGYPELHCETLASALNFKTAMEAARARGCRIYGECGGYMVLGESIIDREGKSHPMLGFLGLETSFAKRKLHLGYRRLEGVNVPFSGAKYNAHEFHYTSAIKETGKPLFSVTDALGTQMGSAGLRNENVFGSYMHLIDRSA